MILYGASGHGKVLVSALNGQVRLIFDDDGTKTTLCGINVCPYSPKDFPECTLLISIGDNGLRKKISEKVRHDFEILKHFSAVIDDTVEMGKGTQILHHATIQIDTIIGKHVIINTSASVDHDCTIGDFVHVAPNSTLCGNVIVGEGTLIGAGSVVLPGVRIGSWCTIGAGSVVRKDVPDNSFVVGNPAKIIR